MDLSLFSDDSFDALKWINTHSHIEGDIATKKATVSAQVSKLQVYVEQINFALEKSSIQGTNTMLVALNDMNLIQREINSLMGTIKQVQQEIGHVHRDSGTYLSNLERLESVFQKLQAAKHGMQESDGWRKLTGELDELLEQNEIHQLSGKFGTLKTSMLAQTGLPGQADREVQLEYFTNRIEAAVSPLIIQFIQQADADNYSKHVYIFESIGRLAQLAQYYRKVHRNILVDKWVKNVESDSICEILSNFYDCLLNFVHQQLKWCSQVGMDSSQPIEVVIETLIYLQSSRETIVEKGVRKFAEKFELLTDISNINKKFEAAVEKIIKDQRINSLKQEELAGAIYGYFATSVVQYLPIESDDSKKLLKELQVNNAEIAETVRSLANGNVKLAKWAEKALSRCAHVTQNYSLPQLVKVFQDMIVSWVENFVLAQKKLITCRTEQLDWNLIQLNINLLQHLGDFMANIQLLSENIAKSAKDCDPAKSIYCSQLSSKQDKRSKFLLSTEEDIFNELFSEENKIVRDAAVRTHDSIMKFILYAIEKHFNGMRFSANKEGEGFNLPDYSYAPQEYITQIGQYLLTLPQHLEPLLLSPSPSLKFALESCDDAYSKDKFCADVLLALIVEETTAFYQESIDNIQSLTAAGSKQLAVDIEYFGNVLEEMSLPFNATLQQTVVLLRTPLEQYNTIGTGYNARLVAKIRQKRNIVSS
uniref:Conserved oligomeric Golgi complex subunit 7 n=2 Tax=Culex pipiens TaxID=7175 RepID=A0A8D8BA89_CULPI